MPHYDYQCDQCGKVYEINHSAAQIDDEPDLARRCILRADRTPGCQGTLYRISTICDQFSQE